MHLSEFKNGESLFTELFSLLKRYDHSSSEFPTLSYTSEELKAVNQHVDNAIGVLLQGLQGIGQLISKVSPTKKMINELTNLGFFISAISNLTEALYDLQADADYVLKERGVMNF